MKFRCPNCRHPIEVLADSSTDQAITDLPDAVTCPSCNSRFSLSDDPPTTVTPESGLEFAQFELRSIVGEGSFGTVYEAWDTELERVVALKVPRRGFVAEGDAAFLKEARLAAGVEHPNIVGVYEIGQVDGQFYIASQFINGISLREKLRATQFSPRETAELLIPILRAVQAFHDRGIIHRDLKPANILLDTDGVPYVADFGLARRSKAGDLAVTQSGRVVGTILYMSPEQARGVVRELTGRTDVYAVGVILYEMLTGKRPFEATESRTVLYRIQTEDPVRLRKIKPGVPYDLECICLKALAKEPTERYPSAKEFADDLGRFSVGAPIQAKPPHLLRRAVKMARRNPLAVSSAAAVTGLLATICFLMMKPPEGTIPVVMNAGGGPAELTFELCDRGTRRPVADVALVSTTAGTATYLRPGIYRVRARATDGRSHEVWRKVPDAIAQETGDPWFHQDYSRSEDGTIVELPAVRLFLDQEIGVESVMIQTGTGSFGVHDNPSALSGVHQQSLPEFRLAKKETSWREFRETLDQTAWFDSSRGTYREEYCRRYGHGDGLSAQADSAVTGFPRDVAIMFCELQGTRLPTTIEWEFAATSPSVESGTLISVAGREDRLYLSEQPEGHAAQDVTARGFIDLRSGVAEFTDSQHLAFHVLYPEEFPSVEGRWRDLSQLAWLVDIRGAPPEWVNGQSSVGLTFDIRDRAAAPFLNADVECAEVYGRIGWRVARSGQGL